MSLRLALRSSSRAVVASLLVTALAAPPLVLPAVAQQPRARRAAPAPVRAESVTTVEGISEYRLPNGLRIVLFPDASRPSTTVNITYFVGSRHEGYGESGMAHVLEHLAFRGTPLHRNIPQELAENGGRANGTTWFDRTNYYITFAPSDSILDWALGLEADRMVNNFMRREDLASEMTVVRNEFEARENNPGLVLMERTLSTAYLWHGYGRSTIGARSDIEHMPIERLQAFYRCYYQPDNAILVVSGRFDPRRTLRMIERHFGPLPRPDRSGALRIYDTYTREPTQDGERSVTVRRVGDVQYLMVAYHVPANSHPDFPAVDLLSHVISNTPSGRLYRALVEPGLAATVAELNILLKREPGTLMFLAQVRTDRSLDSVRAVTLRTLDEVVSNPPTEQEVERARAARLTDVQLTLNNSERVGLGFTEWAAAGDWRLFFLNRDRLRAVTTAEVGRAATSYLRPSNRTVGQFIPEVQPQRVEIPEAPDVASQVSRYRGAEVTAAGEAFEPTPENIEARVRRFDLPDGMRVALLRRQTRGGTVYVYWAQRMGNEADLQGRSAVARLTAAMLMRGTARRTRQELTDTLARLQTQMSVSGSATVVSGSIETSRANLPAVLSLLREVAREPAFDSLEFQTLKRERLASLESQRREPGSLASIALQRHTQPRPPGHPQYAETIDEAVASVQAVTLDQVRAFYREFYGSGAGCNLTVLGDVDQAAVEAFVRDAFGNWPRQRPYRRLWTSASTARDTVITIETPDKPNAVFVASVDWAMRDDHPDYPALTLAGYMIGGGFLNSRLASRIRQREGLSYGVGGSITARPIDTVATFFAHAIYAPQNAERLMAAFREEVERAVRDGFTAEEVEAAKRGWMNGQEVARATDRQLIMQIQNGLFLGRTMAWDAAYEAAVRAVTPEQVNAALRRHLNPARLVIVRAGDFARARAGGN